MIRVDVNPEMMRWARERAMIIPAELVKRFPKLKEWEQGESHPTLKQLENYAKAVHAPICFLFLREPPVEQVPIPDFRTTNREYHERPSPDLLDTIYMCQQRQEWYRDYLRALGETAIPFVGSADMQAGVEITAADIRKALGFDIEERRKMPTWTDALRHFIEQADGLGILVMCNGVVLNNNRRKLNPEEFRGFALADDLAPLIFINGQDTKAAQMFTLAHELAHIWIGQSAISDSQAFSLPDHEVERWCNRVAAELLIPRNVLEGKYQSRNNLQEEIMRLARYFKVSTLVILRRVFDIKAITKQQFEIEYQAEYERLLKLPKGSGGDFYLTQAARVSKRFAKAIVISTLEGQTLHRDAFRLLGFTKLATFRELGHSLGVIP